MRIRSNYWVIALCVSLPLAFGCSSQSNENVITVAGSDTMVNLAQAWAEDYSQVNPDANIQVSGGGSGTGIAKLISGTVDMANASREMKDEERSQASANSEGGKEVKEHTVALDALAVYVHKDNPLDSITLAELADIYGDGGKVTNWSQLKGWTGSSDGDEIVRVSRQNNSGTYAYFQEVVLGKDGQFKLGSIDQSGSKDVVELVSTTPNAIGYSGMGYATDEVKMLPVSTEEGMTGVAPTVATAADGTYPLSRGLYIYTMGDPEGVAKEYLDWIMSATGQEIVGKIGYCPVGADEASESNGDASN